MVDDSRCTSGEDVDLYWVDSLDVRYLDDHIGAIVEALMELVCRPRDRVWSNPYLKGYLREDFRDRLVEASKGNLVPVDEVKPIRRSGPMRLFEIRWTDVQVVQVVRREKRHTTIEVRLLHAEPSAVPSAAIAVHVHEKRTDKADKVKIWQNAEIDRAMGRYRATVVPWLSRVSPGWRLSR